MDRFALPPAARFLNTILLVLQVGSSLLWATIAVAYPLLALPALLSAAIAVGLWFKHPAVYAAVMIAAFISITVSLKTADIVLACSSALSALMALYIRLNLYELKAPPEPDATTD
tara:strand:+ start:383 stop:727 length:345 start_codon:yes stop_codon:yes gene_type:complete